MHVVDEGSENDKLVPMRDVRKGLKVRCRGGMIAAVVCVIKINQAPGVLIKTSEGMMSTATHPRFDKVTGKWIPAF